MHSYHVRYLLLSLTECGTYVLFRASPVIVSPCGHSLCALCILVDISDDFPVDPTFDDTWVPSPHCPVCFMQKESDGLSDLEDGVILDAGTRVGMVLPFVMNEALYGFQQTLMQCESISHVNALMAEVDESFSWANWQIRSKYEIFTLKWSLIDSILGEGGMLLYISKADT